MQVWRQAKGQLLLLCWCMFTEMGMLPSVLPYAAVGYANDKQVLVGCTGVFPLVVPMY